MKPSPTWVNHEFVRGPQYHYSSITDAMAEALGFPELPGGRYGSVIKVHGATARRLRNGLLNVMIPHDSRLLRGKEFGEFIEGLLDGEFTGCYETRPIPMDEQQPVAMQDAGHWSFDVMTDRVTWSQRAHQIFGVEMGRQITSDDVFAFIHPEDRTRVMAAHNDAVYNARDIEVEHRIVVNGEVRHVISRGKPFGVGAGLVASRLAGLVYLNTAKNHRALAAVDIDLG